MTPKDSQGEHSPLIKLGSILYFMSASMLVQFTTKVSCRFNCQFELTAEATRNTEREGRQPNSSSSLLLLPQILTTLSPHLPPLPPPPPYRPYSPVLDSISPSPSHYSKWPSSPQSPTLQQDQPYP